MKHLYFFLSIALLSTYNVARSQWQWGLKGGVSVSHIIQKRDGRDVSRRYFIGSKLVGATLSRPLGKRFRVHHELQFATYGALGFRTAVGNSQLPYRVNSNAYLGMYHAGLSAQLQYFPVPRAFASAGMEIAALVQDNRAADLDLMPFEHRALVGLGYAILPYLSFGLQYNRSLSPFFVGNARHSSLQGNSHYYNHAVQASLEYHFQEKLPGKERPAGPAGLRPEWGGMAILNFTNFIYHLQGSASFRKLFEDNPILINKGVGLFFRRPVAARALLHTELAYTSRGGRSQVFTSPNLTANLMLSYLGLTLAYEYIPRNRLGFQLGMEGARRFGSTFEISDEPINRWDISLVGGCRLALADISFTLRYARSLKPIIDARDDFSAVRQFNQGVQLHASVPFRGR